MRQRRGLKLQEYSDSEIIARVLGGHQDSYGLLVQRYQQPAYKLALVILHHVSDAEDAVSEAFVKAFQALPNCRGEMNFKNWFLKIVHNCCYDILRRRKREQQVADLEEAGAATDRDSLLHNVIKAERQQGLWKALQKLAPDERTAIVMKYYQGASYQDIGGILKWPLGTVASRLHRIRSKLRQLLEESEGVG